MKLPLVPSRLPGFTLVTLFTTLVLSAAWASERSGFNAAKNTASLPISPYDFPFGYPYPEYSVAGASHPAVAHDYMRKEPSRSELKRFAQYSLRLIQTDRAEEAIDFANRYLEKHPEVMRPELLFARTMAEAQLGDLDAAALSMEAAIGAGLPPQRFLAGPRRMFGRLHEHKAFVQLWERHANDLVHGPALGAMTDNSVQVWVRTVSEVPVRVTVSQSADMADPKVSGPVLSRSRDDYTAVVSVDGLDPDTRYHYTVTVADQVIRGEHQTFRTYPTEDRAARFSIAFGGCAGFVPPREMIWDTIDRFDPLALLQLGDNVYIDDPESPDQQRLMYYQRQSRPEYRRLVAGSPTYAIWDDHDFGMDDSEGGPLVDVPYWKPMVLDIFKQNWVNPAYGFSDHPGVWFDFKIADVHFILLDGRFYREDAGRLTGGERIEGATMLGAHQLAWLLRTLKDSDATFKVLVSPVPWNLKSKGSGVRRLDGWAGYAEEREVIFSTIEENGIEGVVLLSSDRHRSDAWRIERPDGYDFYEFASGQFTNQHTHPEIDGALFSFNGTNSFGLLQFDTQAADPEVRYQIVDREGMPREAITLRHSDLRSPNTPVHHAGHRPPISIGR